MDGSVSNWPAFLVYLEQLLVGNKKFKMIANGILGAALSQHPKTLPYGVFYLIQVPIEIVLEYILFMWWPQYEVPYVPWDRYLSVFFMGNSTSDSSTANDN